MKNDAVHLHRNRLTRRGPMGMIILVGITAGCLALNTASAQTDNAAASPAPPAAATQPAPAPPTLPTPADIKKLIVEKNIFAPARKPKKVIAEAAPVSVLAKDMGPRKLKRPFILKGITQIGDQCQAYLYFEEPAEYRAVKIGDVIETIRILDIRANYLICDYGGRKVRIEVDEGSNDALVRLVGHSGSDFYLIGTTVGPDDTYALFCFPGESQPVKYRVGDMVSPIRKIVAIDPGKVTLLDQDGDRITVEAGPPPKR